MAAPNIVNLTQENFGTEVLQSSTPVLVDFWGEYCAPCRALGPILDVLAEEYDGRVKIGKVNVENQQALASNYNVNAVPTMLLFQGGKPTKQMVGLKGKAELKATFDEAVKPR
jgi:thioredoxin 1